jgi:hypothetical protein
MTNNVILFPGTYHSDRKPQSPPEPKEYRCVKNGCGSNRLHAWSDGVVSCARCGEISKVIRCYAVATLGFDDGA